MRVYTLNKKGQAAAEMAILGVLLLVAFASVLQYGQSLGKAQQTKMEAFRRALQKAYVRNGSVSYTLRHNTSQASTSTSFFQGQPSTSEGGGSVTWVKGIPGPQGTTDEGQYAYWQLNKFIKELPYERKYQYSQTGAESDEKMKIPVQVYKVNEDRTNTFNLSSVKTESKTDISYDKTASLIDKSEGTLHTRFDTTVDKYPGDDNTPTPSYKITATLPFQDTTTYNYDQSWVVSNSP